MRYTNRHFTYLLTYFLFIILDTGYLVNNRKWCILILCTLICYGIEIYGNTYLFYLSNLIILNNKILRMYKI